MCADTIVLRYGKVRLVFEGKAILDKSAAIQIVPMHRQNSASSPKLLGSKIKVIRNRRISPEKDRGSCATFLIRENGKPDMLTMAIGKQSNPDNPTVLFSDKT